MSTVVLPIVEETLHQPTHVDVAVADPSAKPEEKGLADPHPLLPVFVFGVISLMLASAFVGSIVVWLMLRNSGVMAQ